NNILSIITGYTEFVMANELPQGSPAWDDLEQVLKASYRARDIIKQILTFSRKSEAQWNPIKLGNIIRENLKFIRASTPATIDIKEKIIAESDIIFADHSQIEQVLINLFTNATYAMSEKGGILTISLEDVILDSDNDYQDIGAGDYLKLKVSDTGSGINPEILDRIFEPYFTTKPKGKGTGIGLAVVYGIVKILGGTITVTSELGKGTVFEILFQKFDSKEISEIEAESVLPKGCERILFIDDEKQISWIAGKILMSLGYDVVIENDSLEALETFKARTESFDLIITDLTMPHMTGVELAKKIMEIRSDIPVILCTGYSEIITSEEARARGIQELLMKPFNICTLAKSIRSVLDRNKQVNKN
ncbi:ATP-binding protein, partial [Candidatus Latescibacterota bacterium]